MHSHHLLIELFCLVLAEMWASFDGQRESDSVAVHNEHGKSFAHQNVADNLMRYFLSVARDIPFTTLTYLAFVDMIGEDLVNKANGI